MIWPTKRLAEPPHPDMPKDMVDDYNEAAAIIATSPRAAAALLRLAIEKLCKHLRPDSSPNLNLAQRVERLRESGGLSETDLAVLEVVRRKGNHAAHATGEISEEDAEGYEALFALVNMIVESQISRPQRVVQLLDEQQAMRRGRPAPQGH